MLPEKHGAALCVSARIYFSPKYAETETPGTKITHYITSYQLTFRNYDMVQF